MQSTTLFFHNILDALLEEFKQGRDAVNEPMCVTSHPDFSVLCKYSKVGKAVLLVMLAEWNLREV